MSYLHSVILPYILRRIIESGSEPQQRCARQTLTHVQTLMAHMPANPPRRTSIKPVNWSVIFTMPDRRRSCRVPRCVMRASRQMAMWPLMKPTIIWGSPMISSENVSARFA